jgi:sister-chromatid-cohesion protein PDS5
MDDDDDWYEDSELPPEVRARILCIKVCRNRCLAHAASESALGVSAPVLKMLSTILANNGSLSANADDE